jgi:hypothetical protein
MMAVGLVPAFSLQKNPARRRQGAKPQASNPEKRASNKFYLRRICEAGLG